MKAAFFKENGSIVEQDILLLNQEVNTVEYDGTQDFKAVMLNYRDESFVKLLLDEISIEFFKK